MEEVIDAKYFFVQGIIEMGETEALYKEFLAEKGRGGGETT